MHRSRVGSDAGNALQSKGNDANSGADTVTSADPVPEAKHVGGVDAKRLCALDVGASGDDVLTSHGSGVNLQCSAPFIYNRHAKIIRNCVHCHRGQLAVVVNSSGGTESECSCTTDTQSEKKHTSGCASVMDETSQFLTVAAFIMVSAVVNVLEITIASVVSGSKPSRACCKTNN